MKKLLLIVSVFAGLLTTLLASDLIIHKTDGNDVSIPLDNIESITFGTNTSGFSDNFNDGDYTNDPVWDVWNEDDIPGTIEIVDNDYVNFKRVNAGGNGGSVLLEKELDIALTNSTYVKFDANPVFSDVGNGAGWNDGEYPINLYLYLEDAESNELILRFCYNYRGGSSSTEDDYIRVSFPECEQNVWLRNQQFTIKDYFSQAVKIKKIRIGGNGWNFEGLIDNIEINQ